MEVQRDSRSGQRSQSYREIDVHNFPKRWNLLLKAKTEVVQDRIEKVWKNKMEWTKQRDIKLPGMFREYMGN